jgi:dTDP-4-dehydrorhamnose 3,5-epimerase-like enzyme
METNFVSSLKLVLLPHYSEENGDLVVMENFKNIPFEIKRVFLVRAPQFSIRGQHAHIECSQFLTCSTGRILVTCDDGNNKINFVLDTPKMGLLIPPGIWAEQKYLTDNSILTVLCDSEYNQKDYIRDYEAFKKFRNLN